MATRVPTGEEEIARWRREAERLEALGAYDPSTEKDSCGVGLVAAIDGKPRREVVTKALEALKALWHRGAVDADGKTGDGAGIHVEVPQDFFRDQVTRTGHKPGDKRIGIGMIFLPRTDFGGQERCRQIVETEVLRAGFYIFGWRQVPVDTTVIGDKANATRPDIEQIMFAVPDGMEDEPLERELYIVRRRIENQVRIDSIKDFYICSLSARSLIYKGMFLAEQLDNFYLDMQDERFISSMAIYHQRYSTNTFPNWWLAQPFRMLAHNGEINTLKGNVNWMKSHEIRMASEAFKGSEALIKPIIQPGSSDSAALDAVFELFVRSGKNAPMAKTILIPEASLHGTNMPPAHRAMYAACNAIMEPWDGPAAICASDGRWVIAGMDRNGLRPLRYSITDDRLLIVGSETGMVVLDEARIVEKGRVGPGQMIAVDLKTGRFYLDEAIKDELAESQDFLDQLKHIVDLENVIGKGGEPRRFERAELRRRQMAAGYSIEDLELILHPMAEDGKEAVGSMGDDVPLAVLSERYRPLSHYFRQNFSQVTNPPIDPLREYRVMSLKTRFRNLGNMLSREVIEKPVYTLDSPILTNGRFERLIAEMNEGGRPTCHIIDCSFDAPKAEDVPGAGLKAAIERIRAEADMFVREGGLHLILTDEHVGPGRVPIPMILAVAAVHSHLVRNQVRTFCSINVRSAECLDTHYFAVLIGSGATTVNAYLAQESIADRHARGLFGKVPLETCIERYREAVNQGLLKIISKMGISVISSYRGGYNFEAVGLSRALVADVWPGMVSRISGIGYAGIEEKVTEQHGRAFGEDSVTLSIGGLYRYRAGGETHGQQGDLIHLLQHATARDDYRLYKKYAGDIYKLTEASPINLRDLMRFRFPEKGVPIGDVESINEIRKRFVTPGMSLGALSPEAHGVLNIAMNRIGAKSDSGEGGEDPARFKPMPNGDNPNSAIKQIASGRFGVTAEYLNKCREIEIKIAQGAKPGEGGQLPGFKVTEMIAKFRHATPGVMLISPPPHHDIYSIEDLAQLIYDLKQINPIARVCVKLVSMTGIGTIAAGVAKAKADVILVSGHSGGTGASPQTSIKYAGCPWEMGLTEANQVLTLNKLRHKIRLRTDGGIRTGRDVVMAAMMGAEEYGVGTASLIAMGCIMVRQCHSNTCPVGVCTQDEALRKRFSGSPEKVVNLFSFIAEEVREILARLGVRTLAEVIGRTDLLEQVSRGATNLDDLDLNPLLVQADAGDQPRFSTVEGRNEVAESLDAQIVRDAAPMLNEGEKMQLAYAIRNTHRAIGARISSHIVNKFGMKGLQGGHLTVRLRGSAGQSLGAFAVQGLKLEVQGDANDYVGKGLSGGTIVIRPHADSRLKSNEHTIIGNTVLYGATSGKLFAAGQAGERFAVRNSGAEVVIEGCGANGCEYMTGGTAVILGPVGDNFGAGMTGGMSFVLDTDSMFETRVNPDTILWQRIQTRYWEDIVHKLVTEHAAETGSLHAQDILAHWDLAVGNFWQVCPKDMVDRLAFPLTSEPAVRRA